MQKIPKIIHQTYPTKDLPHPFATITTRLQALNPDWEYRLYDDQDVKTFIAQEYGQEYLYLYQRINPCYGAARADFFRYLVIYKYGGAYFDIKSLCTQPLQDIIREDDEILLSFWSPDSGYGRGWKELTRSKYGELQQWHIIAIPQSPFIKLVIDKVIANILNYSPWTFGVSSIGVLRVTGPIAYTQAIFPKINTYVCRFGPFDQDLGLVYSGLEAGLHHSQIYKFYYDHFFSPIILPSQKLEYLSWYPPSIYWKARRIAGKIKRYILQTVATF